MGLILLFVEGMTLFRHPTRQLTSSAKAKEVKRPPYLKVLFLWIYTKIAFSKMGLFFITCSGGITVGEKI